MTSILIPWRTIPLYTTELPQIPEPTTLQARKWLRKLEEFIASLPSSAQLAVSSEGKVEC